MGFLDALSDLASAAVKVAVSPVAVTKDTVNVVLGEEPNATKDLLKSAANDIDEIIDDLER